MELHARRDSQVGVGHDDALQVEILIAKRSSTVGRPLQREPGAP